MTTTLDAALARVDSLRDGTPVSTNTAVTILIEAVHVLGQHVTDRPTPPNPLHDLADRLRAADATLIGIIREGVLVPDEAIRIAGKREGIRTALSYVEEALR